MKIVVLNGSPRKGGNTEIMTQAFAEAARKNQNEVSILDVAPMNIRGCLGCKYCWAHKGECVQKDDMGKVFEALVDADMVVFASPIYWFDISAQIKCFIDRMYACAKTGFHITSAAMLLDSGSPGVYNAAQAQLKDICDYLKWENKGAFTAPGMVEKGSIYQSAALAQVRTFAENL